jgi:hypothetical protein
MDSSPLGGTLGVIVCLCAGECSLDLLSKTQDERKAALTHFLSRSFGDAAPKNNQKKRSEMVSTSVREEWKTQKR